MRRLRENEWVEITSEQIQSIQREIVAFLNTNGGTIYVGISTSGMVLGVKNIERVIQELQKNIQEMIKPNATAYIKLEQIYPNKKPVIIIEVQKGHAKPYFLIEYGLTPRGVYIGTKSTMATQKMINQMIKETDGDNFEKRRALNQNLTFHYLKSLLKKELNKKELDALGLLSQDELYTNLAFLISDQCHYKMKVAVFEKEKKIHQYIFTGSLLKQWTEVYHYLKAYCKEDYPDNCIKEVLLNAIIHRAYHIEQDSVINLYETFLEVISIGGLLFNLTIEDLLVGLSIYRNPNLVQFFLEMHFITAQGTGLRKILRAYSTRDKQPDIIATKQLFKVTLPHLAYCKEKPLAISKNATLLKEKEYAILSIIQSQGPISRAIIEKQVKMSTSAVNRILKKLKDEQLIHTIGKGKSIKYIKS